jgi:dinuclear metal center YbgI/SA1388 family protein
MTTVGEIVALLEDWYPPHRADDWDRVGLICGDPSEVVERILLAVDPVQAVAQQAVAEDADLLVVHHPLYLRGTSSVAVTDPKGRVVHDLVRSRCALYAAHTNADAPRWGVSESLAVALGLEEIVPLQLDPIEPMDKLVVFAPVPSADAVRSAITAAGAGAIGNYADCTFSGTGDGRFRPLEGANPTIGSIGKPELVAEVRIESVMPRAKRNAVIAAMCAAHPYEEPAYDVFEMAALPDNTRGSGRIGALRQPMSLREFAQRVREVLPQTAHGIRVAGDPHQIIRTVALCGGAGDFLLDRARSARADVYLTSDLRHHPASEFREHDGPALIDVAHWAAEWTWLPVLADRLRNALVVQGANVEVQVSETATDPWTFRL